MASNEIEAADDERIRALVAGDAGALESLHAEELVYVHSNAYTETRPAYLKNLGQLRFLDIRRHDARVRMWGDFALLDCKVEMDFEMGGSTRSARSKVVSAWVRRDGRWQLAHYQSTAIPQK